MYCSIQEAFEENIPAPRRSKKRREKERHSTDPDRPANVPMQPAEYVGGGGNYTGLLTAVESDSSFFPTPTQDSSQNTYMLDPDWTKQFDGPSLPPWIKERVAAKEAEIPLKPQVSSWMEGNPTLWQKVPTSYTSQNISSSHYDIDEKLQQFESKIDSKLERMFAKLNEIDRGHSESNHIEIILFIIGGLFVILMLDMLVKQGTRATILLAAAGGAKGGALELYKRYMT